MAGQTSESVQISTSALSDGQPREEEQVWSTGACADETDNVTQLRWPDGSGRGRFR